MDLSTRFALIVRDLLRALMHRAGPDRSFPAVMFVLYGRLNRMAARLDALLARYRAGTLKPARPRAERAPKPAMFGPPAPRKPDIVPRRHGWIMKLGAPERWQKGYLEQLLADPEMKDFLEAAPQAWRIIRPLCRMLMVEHGVNGIPFPPKLTPRKPRPPKARAPREALEPLVRPDPPGWPAILGPRRPSIVIKYLPGSGDASPPEARLGRLRRHAHFVTFSIQIETMTTEPRKGPCGRGRSSLPQFPRTFT